MKYWGYFGAKLAASAAILFGIWRMVLLVLPPARPFLGVSQPRFAYDLGFTLAAGGFFLVCCGTLYLCVLDQRYRCRVCLRRLRMPVGRGSWRHMLQLGRPRTEYICTFGHGTLMVPETQISGTESLDWEAHGDIWEELSSPRGDRK